MPANFHGFVESERLSFARNNCGAAFSTASEPGAYIPAGKTVINETNSFTTSKDFDSNPPNLQFMRAVGAVAMATERRVG